MNKLLDLAALTAVTVFTTGATIFFAKATGNGVKDIGKTFMSILKSKQHLNPQNKIWGVTQ